MTAVAATMVIVQAAEVAVGHLIRDLFKMIGPAATAAANLAALIWMYTNS